MLNKPYCYIVMVLGYWGRGQDLRTAARVCKKEGGRAKDKAVAILVVGDSKAEIDRNGNLLYDGPESYSVNLGRGFKLSHLLNLDEY